jgi:thioredoxin 1
MSVTPIASLTEFEEVISGSKATVVYFWATWAGPCKTMRPMLEELSQDPEISDVDFYKVDVDALTEVTQRVGVNSAPTVMFFSHGQMLDAMAGSAPQAKLKAFVQQVLSGMEA